MLSVPIRTQIAQSRYFNDEQEGEEKVSNSMDLEFFFFFFSGWEGSMVIGLEIEVQGLGFRVLGFWGFRVKGVSLFLSHS